jgi:hypothetical protein
MPVEGTLATGFEAVLARISADLGFSGWGGSFLCADSDVGVGISYVRHQTGPDLGSEPHTKGPCTAVLDAAAKL